MAFRKLEYVVSSTRRGLPASITLSLTGGGRPNCILALSDEMVARAGLSVADRFDLLIGEGDDEGVVRLVKNLAGLIPAHKSGLGKGLKFHCGHIEQFGTEKQEKQYCAAELDTDGRLHRDHAAVLGGVAMSAVSEADLAQAQRERGWTEHRVSVVQRLLAKNYSTAQVACLIGGGATRSAIIGLNHRRALTDIAPTPATPKKTVIKPGRMVAVGRSTVADRLPAVVARPRPATHPAAPAIIDAAIPTDQRRQLVDLDKRCCHWPVGEPGTPEFFFCGAVVTKDKHPYCPSHMARAHDRSPRARSVPQKKSTGGTHVWS